MFLYAFAKGYALHHGCELQVPVDWWGRQVFENCNEPPITANPSSTELDSKGKRGLGYFFGQKNVDLFVYGQHQIYVDFYTRAQVREWFKFRPELLAYSTECEPYSAAHLRRGDYTDQFRKKYCTVSDVSYERAIREFRIPDPIKIVTEGWRPEPPALKDRGLGWIPDFLLLRDAAYLLRANSTFSVWAGWLGHGKVYAPVVKSLVGWQDVSFVEGNYECTAGIFHNQSDLHLKEK